MNVVTLFENWVASARNNLSTYVCMSVCIRLLQNIWKKLFLVLLQFWAYFALFADWNRVGNRENVAFTLILLAGGQSRKSSYERKCIYESFRIDCKLVA